MRSLTPKLLLAFLAVSLAAVALIAVFLSIRTARDFDDFVFDQNREDTVNRLADYYRVHGNWAGAEAVLPGPRRGGPGGGQGNGPFTGIGGNAPQGPPPGFTLLDAQGRVVVHGSGPHHMGEKLPPEQVAGGLPVEVDGAEVGRLIAPRGSFDVSPSSALFIFRFNQTLILSALGAGGAALLLGVFLARTLTRPLRELTEATQAVAAGDLDRQVPVRSKDELGQLASAFNQMNAQLARARDLRRQMTADVAHELRTPLSVILGHAEALSEGVLPPTPETFEVIHDEARQLSRLVDDLRTLSLAEAGELGIRPRKVAPEQIIERGASSFSARAQNRRIQIERSIAPGLPAVLADTDRMAQVLSNLLDNALRYSPEGSTIVLAAAPAGDGVELRVKDSGPGIPQEELAQIFDRFYRGDKARNRLEGGSGLGLAIARSIVEGHGGHLRAESQSRQGTTMIVWLPGAGQV